MKQKGVALLLALFTLIIISLLVVAFLAITTTDLQIISNHLSRNQALYIADAGVEYAVARIRYNRSSFAVSQIAFPPGSYNVTYTNTTGTVASNGTLSSGPVVRLQARISVVENGTLDTVRIISWREP
jgi:type II secretory pathway component PulK